MDCCLAIAGTSGKVQKWHYQSLRKENGVGKSNSWIDVGLDPYGSMSLMEMSLYMTSFILCL